MAGFFSRMFQRKSSVTTLELFREVFGGSPAKSGQRVNIETAIQVATVFACLRVLADGVAQVPLKLYRTDGRRRLPATDHPLYTVLHRQPNEWQTSYEYRETMMLHVGLTGRHFSFINRVRGQVAELIPLDPGRVTVKRSTDLVITYEVLGLDGSKMLFPREALWHVRGPSWDSFSALQPVRLAREAIGLSQAIEEQQARFYETGASPSGLLSVEGTLDDEQNKRLRAWLEKDVQGAKNAGRPFVLDRNSKWMQMSMSGVDAQTLEQRKFQIEEICRAFRVMPIMVGYSDKAATYASAEQMFLAHVVHTLSPWYERLEQSIDANLLSDADRRAGLYAKFVEEGLLRGSLKDTKDYLLGLVNGGLMTPNEGREKLDLDPDTDPASDQLRVPQNVVGAPAAEEPALPAN